MDGANDDATTVEEYLAGTPSFRTNLYSNSGTLMTHAQSIALFKKLKVKMTPELKSPQVDMPFNGFSQQDFANKMLAEYKQANVPVEHVFPQSFNLNDIKHWIKNSPEFAKQTVFLDGREQGDNFDPMQPSTFNPSMAALVESGVKILAPPIWMLITTDKHNKIVPSAYAKQAKAAGLELIAWTFERTGNYNQGGGWYYQSVNNAIKHDADQLIVLDVLAKQIGVKGVFADWPGTVSYYANCMGK
jgi:glycerophosphoryl diester phosphodiesterase